LAGRVCRETRRSFGMRDGRSRSPLCDGGGQGGGLGNSAAAGGRRRVGPRWLCVLVALVACLGAADAVHFQSGTVDFEVMEGTERTVVFTLRTMWLRSYSAGSVFEGSGEDERAIVGDIVDLTGTEPVQLDAGDGSPPYSLKLIVQKASPEEDWIYGASTVIHTYPPSSCVGRFCPAAAFTAVLQGCCRRSVHGAGFSISTRVTFSGHVSVASAGLPVQVCFFSKAQPHLEISLPSRARGPPPNNLASPPPDSRPPVCVCIYIYVARNVLSNLLTFLSLNPKP
jgi:hypothetical protein